MSQHLDQPYDTWIGRTVRDPTGQRIGKAEDVYTDDDSGRPEWLAVVPPRSGSDVCFLPVAGASWEDDDEDLWVPFPREKVREAPRGGRDGRLSLEDVTRLRAYYGCEPPPRRARRRRGGDAWVSLFTAPDEELGPVTTRVDADEPAPPVRAAESERVPLSASFDDDWRDRPETGHLDLDEPARPCRYVERERVSLSASFDEEPVARADSPLSWNHDDRIDSIRPPADRWAVRR